MADVLSGGRDPGSGSGPGPGREFSRSQVLIALVVLVLLVTGGLRLLFGGGDDPAQRPTESPPVRNTLPAVTRVPDGPDAEIDPAEPPGVVVTNVDIGGTHDTIDQRAAAGAWTVVVRRKDGSLGRHGAVITFPVPSRTSPARSPWAARRAAPPRG
ncbi:hypothetical protein [Spirillospora sp. NPDC047279]|uniref:hypothetical protein n=1 Tax=Spirillospora sp. NPDC047279 TaxID=3155478 RepID=UPI0033CDA082